MGFLTPQATGELGVLKTYALQQLAQLRTTEVGLSNEQAHSHPTASALNLTGLLRHCGAVGVYWSACAVAAPDAPQIPDGFDDLPLEDMIADESTLEETLVYFDRCVDLTTANFDAVTDLSAPVPVPPAPWYPPELTSWEARWCLAHISTEVARHTGHADIIRESIDGKGAYELNDLAEAL